MNLQTDNAQVKYVNSIVPPTQKVAFYGVEDEDLTLWKMAFWLMNDPNNVPYRISKPKENQGFFSAGDDAIAVAKFNENLADYEMKFLNSQRQFQQYQGQLDSWHCKINPFCLAFATALRNKWRKRMDAWELGVNWWMNSTEYWDLLTGARTFEPIVTTTTTTETYCTCYTPTPTPDNLFVYTSVNCVPFQPNDICNEITNTTTTTTIEEVYKSNDGVVLSESAQDFRGVDSLHVMPLSGSCHFQMRNDKAFQDALYYLYNNDDNKLTSFKTPIQDF